MISLRTKELTRIISSFLGMTHDFSVTRINTSNSEIDLVHDGTKKKYIIRISEDDWS